MQMLFKGFPDRCESLKSIRDGALATSSSTRWSTEWETDALPLISKASFICYSVGCSMFELTQFDLFKKWPMSMNQLLSSPVYDLL